MAKWLLQIHDDTMMEAPEERAEEYGNIMKECFEQTVQDRFVVPILAEVKIGHDWGHMEGVGK